MVGALRVRPGCTGGEVPPEGTKLVEGPSPASGGLWDVRRRRTSLGFGVTNNAFSGEHSLGESCRSHHVVLLWLFVCLDKH